MEGYKFDAAYIEKLRAGDTRTQEHFVGYLTEILHLKLRQRLHSPEEIGRVRQKSFERVLMGLRLHQPESLGAFVNTVCNNILFEHHRSKIAIERDSTEESLVTRSNQLRVREILSLPIRDRQILKAIFLDERDRDEVAKEFGVDREYLRVLVHRIQQKFKAE